MWGSSRFRRRAVQWGRLGRSDVNSAGRRRDRGAASGGYGFERAFGKAIAGGV